MTDTSGPLSLDERIAAARREAERSTGQVTGFGENLVDRLFGAGSAAGYGIMGGVTDLAGNLGAFLGGPFSKDAATLEMFSDEAYRRALPLLLEGYSEGSKTAAQDALPMFLFEEKAMREAEAAKQKDPFFLGEFGDIAMPSEIDPKAASEQFGDVEFQMDDIAKDLAALGPVSKKMDADAKAAVESKSTISDPTVKSKTEQMSAEAFRAREAQMAGKIGTTALDKAFVAALQDVEEARGDTPPKGESREDALARYKKEFEEATGIDASGKVDKSKALMAFGLALMQNKAGRGFNVGKMLASVGEAGQAAMPALEKAEERASAAKLAAGKYALQQIENDENARAALAKEQRLAAKEAQLKWIDFQQEVFLKNLEGKEISDSKDLEIIPGLKILVGTSGGKSVFSRPEFTARTVGNAYRTTQVAMSELGKIEDAILEVQSSGSPAIKLVADQFNTFLVGIGLKDAKVTFGESGVSPAQQAQALRDSLIAEFKRFLTQETGNGISNVDIQNMERLMGKMDIFGNPQDALNRVDQVRGIFEAKATALTPFINDLADPYYYVNDNSFQKAQEALATSMGYGGSKKQPSQADGRTVIDLTGG
jgi:hypothetical protein